MGGEEEGRHPAAALVQRSLKCSPSRALGRPVFPAVCGSVGPSPAHMLSIRFALDRVATSTFRRPSASKFLQYNFGERC